LESCGPEGAGVPNGSSLSFDRRGSVEQRLAGNLSSRNSSEVTERTWNVFRKELGVFLWVRQKQRLPSEDAGVSNICIIQQLTRKLDTFSW
jgi:hypothetical protein